LGAAIDWSYNLLSGTERVMLRRLSVFAGGWTLEAAESVCVGAGVEATSILDVLASLVDKSLVQAETLQGEARYRLLETVRQYAHERLAEAGEDSDVRARHRDWYVALAEHAQADLRRGQRSQLWLDQLERDHDNLRAALEGSEANKDGAEAGLRLVGALNWFWFLHGHFREAQGWLERALARSADAPRSALPTAFIGAARFAFYRNEYEVAATLGEKSLALSREIGDRDTCWWALLYLGTIAMAKEDFARARTTLDECLKLAQALANDWFQGITLSQLGVMAWVDGDLELATAYDEQGINLLRAVGDPWSIAFALRNHGSTSLRRNDYGRAVGALTESLTICRNIGDRWVATGCLNVFAQAASAQGQYERAARLFGAEGRQREEHGIRWTPHTQAPHDEHLAHTRAGLGDAAFLSALAAGRAMDLEQAIEYALAREAD
jgi:non-specific serine/threonine protein kinase